MRSGVPLLWLAPFGMAACGDSTEPLVPTTVEITAQADTLFAIGDSVGLVAVVLDQQGGTIVGSTVVWMSQNPSAVAVTEVGLSDAVVTAIGAGTARVSATVQNASGFREITVSQRAAALQAFAGDGQAGRVDQPLLVDPTVQVNDARGHPIANALVTFSVTAGGGQISASDVPTTAAGQAWTQWRLGQRSTDLQKLTVTVAVGPTIEFTATAEPGPPSFVQVDDGDGQTGLAGEELAQPLAVQVSDAFGNPTPEINVSWVPLSGEGTFDPANSQTDGDGRGTSRWTLGPASGAASSNATVPGLPSVTFAATALPNAIIEGRATPVSASLSPALAAGLAPFSPSIDRSKRTGSDYGLVFPAREMPLANRSEGLSAADELLIEYVERAVPGSSASPAEAEALGTALRARASSTATGDEFEVIGVSPVIRTVRVRVRTGVNLAAIVSSLSEDPSVGSVERNGRAWISDRTRPSGPEPRPTWSLTTFPSSEPLYPWQAWHYEAIGVVDAWKLTTGDPGIIVAVVDDGIRFDHPDIAGNLTADGYDFVSDQQVNRCSGGLISASGDGDGPDPDPTIPSTYHWDDSLDCAVGPAAIGAHGLHVAGTIAALGQNDYGGVGVAPDVQIRPVRVIGVPGFGSNYDIAQGILYAAGLPADNGMGGVVQPSSGSHVINLSLGGPGDTQVLRSAVSAADAAGSLVVASAGNDDSFTPSFPAAYPQAIAVAAVGPTLGRAPYSSMGSHVEIAAPGGNLAGHDEGWGVISTRWDFSANGPAFQAIQGTSMASPHVSGVAALLFAQDPSLSNAQVRSRLTQHAVDLGAPGRDPQFGFGLVDAISALTDGQGIPGDSHVRLYDAGRGSLVDEQTQGPSGSFRFAGLEDGDYLVFAGLDESFDGLVGAPPRPWGALGGSARPMTMVIRGAGTRDGSFSFGQPIEGEPNDAFGSSNRLVFPSYLNADLASGLDEDVYEIRIPNGGTYAFETTGNLGACGFALGGDTVLELLDQSGTVLAENDDIDVDRQNYCSRILQSLAPGQYFLRVSAFNSDRAGRYRILAREGG